MKITFFFLLWLKVKYPASDPSLKSESTAGLQTEVRPDVFNNPPQQQVTEETF